MKKKKRKRERERERERERNCHKWSESCVWKWTSIWQQQTTKIIINKNIHKPTRATERKREQIGLNKIEQKRKAVNKTVRKTQNKHKNNTEIHTENKNDKNQKYWLNKSKRKFEQK